MPQIREIGVRRIGVPDISVGKPIPPPVLPAAPPVTSAAFPVIEMPGCVRARISKGKGVETFEDDPRGTITLCDGAVPVYEAPDYRPRDFTWVQPPEARIKKPEPVARQRSLPKCAGCRPRQSKAATKFAVPTIWRKEIGSFNKLGTEVLAAMSCKMASA